ncbi:nucleotidyltransferase family protein [Gloeocapsopsis dulcis]|nr:nucleotidyltransferase family protein [Gloeocapsopsis dulcis]
MGFTNNDWILRCIYDDLEKKIYKPPINMKNNLFLAQEKVNEFCQRWKIIELSLFGSIVRDDFRSDSDIDVLVAFNSDVPWTLLDLVDMQQELEQLLGRKVDFVEKQTIEQSPNWIRRQEILSTAQTVYVKR